MTTGSLITADWQVEWRGVLWGDTATWAITALEGWHGWTMRGSNAERPGRHGSFPGLKRVNERTIEVELTAMADDWSLLRGLRAACAYAEDPVEEELVVWAGDDDPQYVMARLERLAIPTDHEWSIGHHRATLQFVASDPKRYSVEEHQSALIGLPAAGPTGLVFPLTFPLSFGAGGSSNLVTVTNAGDVATWSTLLVFGPVDGATITDQASGRKLQFAPTFEIALGQTMTIDTDARSVTVDGVGRSGDLVTREWFPLAPGDNTLVFTGSGAYDPSAGLQVRWRDASN